MMSDLELISVVSDNPDQQTQARRQLTCTAVPTRISELWQAATLQAAATTSDQATRAALADGRLAGGLGPLGDLGVCESGDVGGVELLEFNRGAPAQGAVASLPVMEDLQILKDGIGQLDTGVPALPVKQLDLHPGVGYANSDVASELPVRFTMAR
jgi:hypothetical protein